jgi:MoxR-like ATPase
MQTSQMEALEAEVAELAPWVTALREEIGKVIVGQRYLIDGLLIGLLAQGHLLLEGVPGLAKTTAVRTLARSLDLSFSRIQFTPDLLPADLLGTQIYNPREASFRTHRGPVFAHLVLADEINRAPAKVQSALLEAMQEGQVTLSDQTHDLPSPFLVLATQNPIEQEGTYPLPEAQVDRFMLKLRVDYPDRAEEQEILRRSAERPPEIRSVASLDQIRAAQALTRRIIMEDVVAGYIVDLVRATRNPAQVGLAELERYIEFGASPRATIALAAASRAHALLDLRSYVTPDDVKAVGLDVLRHRVLLTYEAEAEDLTSEAIIKRLFDRVKTP